MKKSILIVAIAALSVFSAKAHNHKGPGACKSCPKAESIKPKKGNISTEFVLSIKGSNPLFNLDGANEQHPFGALKGRYFLKNDLALRGSLGLNHLNESTATGDRKTTEFSLAAGVEKHFKGTRRLSPYVGAELNFKHIGQSISGRSTEDTQVYGASALLGADYYIVPKVYVGLEAGLGFQHDTTSENTLIGTSMMGGLRFGFVF